MELLFIVCFVFFLYYIFIYYIEKIINNNKNKTR